MSELLFGELRGLKGGKKQAWVRQHLELIWQLHENIGFEATRQLLCMKVDTLYSALKRAERAQKPAITTAERSLLVSERAELSADEAIKRVNELEARLDRERDALRNALILVEAVLKQLKLALGGEVGLKASEVNLESGAHQICVTSSKHNTAPLLIPKRLKRVQPFKPSLKRAPSGQGGAT